MSQILGSFFSDLILPSFFSIIKKLFNKVIGSKLVSTNRPIFKKLGLLLFGYDGVS